MPKLVQTAAPRFSSSSSSSKGYGRGGVSEALKGFTDILIAEGNKQEEEDLRQLKRREAEDSRQRGIQEALASKQLIIDRDKENYDFGNTLTKDHMGRVNSKGIQSLLGKNEAWQVLSPEKQQEVYSQYTSGLGDTNIRNKATIVTEYGNHLFQRGDMNREQVDVAKGNLISRLYPTASAKQIEIMLKDPNLTSRGKGNGRKGNAGTGAIAKDIAGIVNPDDGLINNLRNPLSSIADTPDINRFVGALRQRGVDDRDIYSYISQNVGADGVVVKGKDFTGDNLDTAVNKVVNQFGTSGRSSAAQSLNNILQATVNNGVSDASVAESILGIMQNLNAQAVNKTAADAYNKEKDGNTPTSIVEAVAGNAPQTGVPPSIQEAINQPAEVPEGISIFGKSEPTKTTVDSEGRTNVYGNEGLPALAKQSAVAADSLMGALGNAGSLWADGATAVKDGVTSAFGGLSDALANRATSARSKIKGTPEYLEAQKAKTGISAEENADIDSQISSQDGRESLSEIMENDLNSQNPDNVSKLENLLRTDLNVNTRGMVEQALKRLKQNIA